MYPTVSGAEIVHEQNILCQQSTEPSMLLWSRGHELSMQPRAACVSVRSTFYALFTSVTMKPSSVECPHFLTEWQRFFKFQMLPNIKTF